MRCSRRDCFVLLRVPREVEQRRRRAEREQPAGPRAPGRPRAACAPGSQKLSAPWSQNTMSNAASANGSRSASATAAAASADARARVPQLRPRDVEADDARAERLERDRPLRRRRTRARARPGRRRRRAPAAPTPACGTRPTRAGVASRSSPCAAWYSSASESQNFRLCRTWSVRRRQARHVAPNTATFVGRVVLDPPALRHDRDVVPDGLGAQRAGRALLARADLERVVLEELHRVEVRDLVDLVVGEIGRRERLHHALGRVRPHRVAVRVVGLDADAVGADLARLARAEVVLDEAQDHALHEHLARQLAAEVGERPRLVHLVGVVDALEEVGDPADPAFRQRDRHVGELA